VKVQDQLGFLPREVDFCFSLGELRPRPNHAQIDNKWKQRATPDGYVYPFRQDHLQQLPYSHDLFIEGKTKDKLNLRRGLSGFLIQFVGFLYGYRVQFSDWWVDGRVSIKSYTQYNVPCSSLGSTCINQAIKTWRSLDQTTQQIFTNALYMFSRSAIFEFGWERFIAEYTILDAIYKAGLNSNAIESLAKKDFENSMHKARLNAIAKSCGIRLPTNDRLPTFDGQHDHGKKWDKFFVDLRNNLFHEMRWDGIGTLDTPVDLNAEQAPDLLHEFTRRVILSILGIKGKYIKTEWWVKGTHSFDVEVQ